MHATLTYPALPGGRFFTKEGVRVYCFGFNGKEKVDEIYGDANAYDFGDRVCDPRLARFLSVDPAQKKYPEWSPYSFAIDNPIKFLDVNGNGPGDGLMRVFTAFITVTDANGVAQQVYLAKRYYQNVTTEQVAGYQREMQTPNGWYMISKAEYEAQNGRPGNINRQGRLVGASSGNPNALTFRVYGADTPARQVNFSSTLIPSLTSGQPLSVSANQGVANFTSSGVDQTGNPVNEIITFSILDPSGNPISTQTVNFAGGGTANFPFTIPEGGAVSFTSSNPVATTYTANATVPALRGDNRAPDNIQNYNTETPTPADAQVIQDLINE